MCCTCLPFVFLNLPVIKFNDMTLFDHILNHIHICFEIFKENRIFLPLQLMSFIVGKCKMFLLDYLVVALRDGHEELSKCKFIEF